MTLDDRLSRRSFLVGASAAGGGLALGIAIPAGLGTERGSAGPCEINCWVVIQPDDAVIVRVARAEMGQGASTGLAMLVAEELECDWNKVRLEFVAPEQNALRQRVWRDMSTGASRSISASQQYLREAGAAAREMLIGAAAARWDVATEQCTATNGVIIHTPSKRRLTFGEVAEDAARIAPPKAVTLKDPKDWKLAGTPRRRLEIADKVTGKPIYAIDVRLPDMLYAAIVHCPVFKGRLKAVDDTAVKSMKGIRHIVRMPDSVAVVAESWWQAKRAADALPITWDDGGNGQVSSASIGEYIHAGLDATDARLAHSTGDLAAAFAGAAQRIDAEYSVPFLAHATMEPQTCTAHVTPDRVEIWAPTQDAETALATAAAAAGMPNSKVAVHRMMLGGGFGRRGTVQEYIREAVIIAKEVGRPVKLVWTREEDISHDFYRPAVMARFSAGLDAAGMPVALKMRLSGPPIVSSMVPGMLKGFVDKNFLQGLLEEMAYDVPNILLDYSPRPTHVPIGVWRAVNYTQNAFFKESFVDELAHAACQDPYRYRRALLRASPKHLAVLDAAANKADWDGPLPPGVFRGIALSEGANTICAHVAEVSVGSNGKVRVHRVIAAIDCGYVVNPMSIEMQVQSAIVYGLTAALHGEITIKDGRAEQSNFSDYEMLRMADMPQVKTVLVPSGGFWGGIGEPPLPPLAPAVCNAVFAATGKRIRSLPLKNHDLRKTI
jgi:isoquinoline 1-oxidoreductase beta subunit